MCSHLVAKICIPPQGLSLLLISRQAAFLSHRRALNQPSFQRVPANLLPAVGHIFFYRRRLGTCWVGKCATTMIGRSLGSRFRPTSIRHSFHLAMAVGPSHPRSIPVLASAEKVTPEKFSTFFYFKPSFFILKSSKKNSVKTLQKIEIHRFQENNAC